MIKTIKSKEGLTLAIIWPQKISSDGGVKFLTPDDYPLQIGLIQHKEDKIIKAHKHAEIDAHIKCQMQEFIYVEKGKVKVKIYDNGFSLIKTIMLRQGDFMLQISGGHEFFIYKNSRLIEVKQGPYSGQEKAKIYKD